MLVSVVSNLSNCLLEFLSELQVLVSVNGSLEIVFGALVTVNGSLAIVWLVSPVPVDVPLGME